MPTAAAEVPAKTKARKAVERDQAIIIKEKAGVGEITKEQCAC